MQQPSQPIETTPLSLAAKRLRVPSRWLWTEIEAGRLPALITGKSALVHVPTVAALLAERAKRLPESGGAA